MYMYIVSTYIFLVGFWVFEVQGTIFILRKGGLENSNFSLLYVLKISLTEVPLSLIVHINSYHNDLFICCDFNYIFRKNLCLVFVTYVNRLLVVYLLSYINTIIMQLL